jgi:hypothetical protein
MVLRFVLLAGLLAATLAVVQQKQVLQNAHLTGYCARVATPAGQTGAWHECHAGKVTGMPGLSRGSCIRMSQTADLEVWRCPTPLESNQARQ